MNVKCGKCTYQGIHEYYRLVFLCWALHIALHRPTEGDLYRFVSVLGFHPHM